MKLLILCVLSLGLMFSMPSFASEHDYNVNVKVSDTDINWTGAVKPDSLVRKKMDKIIQKMELQGYLYDGYTFTTDGQYVILMFIKYSKTVN